MFIRKKHNKSGSISVQILEKREGKNKLLRTVGCSKNEKEIEQFVREAALIIPELMNQERMNFGYSLRDQIILDFAKYNKSLRIYTVGPELVLGGIFDSLGFNIIAEELFRYLVITRLVYPASKLKTIDYLKRHQGLDIAVSTIYKFLDRLNERHKSIVEQVAYENTKKVLKDVSVVFYDMTTLYFEAEDEDDLRKIGYSKDGKFNKPQIMLGLLVGENGYPIGYDIFEGNSFEGHTLLPIIEKIQRKYELKQPIVVADAGLLSKNNLKKLGEQGYGFIIGARIKSETGLVKQEILKQLKNIKTGDVSDHKKEDGLRLIVSYSDKRAQKDAQNRTRGIKRLKARLRGNKLTKAHINNRGYNKFLSLRGEIKVLIDEDKIKADQQWDGLKGYITNTKLSARKVINNYNQLWHIEKAFRISKTDLRIRPIHHYKRRRIEAHICICFVAYTIWKELERLLKKHGLDMSPQKAIEQLETIYEMKFTLPDSAKEETVLANLSAAQQKLLTLSRI